MKAALLLFGQPRFLDNPMVVDSFAYLNSIFNIDVFCHTWWSEYEDEYSFSDWTNMEKCPVNKNAINIINEIYKPIEISYDSSVQFKTDKNINRFILDKFPDDKFWDEKHSNNIQSQLFSIQKVSRLFEKYKEDYDIVILDRYDTYLKHDQDISNINKDYFYLSDIHPRFPDMVLMYGTKYLEWSSNVYDDFFDKNVYENIWKPRCEAFKAASFMKRFDINQARSLKIDSIAIRK